MTTAESISKKYIALRSYFLGRKFYSAAKALTLVKELEEGKFRKDGVTPSFAHHLYVAAYVSSLDTLLLDREDTVTVAILHDLIEDYDFANFSYVSNLFGQEVASACSILNKKAFKSLDEYYRNIATCSIASVVKPVDRVHNLISMHGVFSNEKAATYTYEVDNYFMPMLKQARANYPEQEMVYMSLKYNLEAVNLSIKQRL